MSAKKYILIFIILNLISCYHPKHRYRGYVEGETIYLANPFSGILMTKHVERGDTVKKGQLLFELDEFPQKFAVMRAEAALAQGKQTLNDLQLPRRTPELEAIKAQIAQVEADIALASIRLRRNQALYKKAVIPKDTLDAAVEYVNERQAMKAQLEANLAYALLGARPNQIEAQIAANQGLQASLEDANWSLKQKKIFAPHDGFIFDIFYQQGEFVDNNAPVAALLTAQNTYIEFFVPLQDMQYLKVGDTIHYQYLNQSKLFSARIGYISPTAEYVPPLIYSRDNMDHLVFRIKAWALEKNTLFSGEPILAIIEETHG